MASRHAGGRPAAPIIQANFTVIEKVNNKSNRYWYKCNHCADGTSGSRIQGRDNNHVKHLTDPKKCPNAPSDVRKEARIFLAGKGGDHGFFGISTPGTSAETAISLDSPSPTNNNVIAVKKRKGNPSTLDGFVDHPLTLTQQQRANIKLFRFIVHANLAFSVAENPYFREFTDEIRPSYKAPSRYVISHSIMDGEAARVQMEEIARLKPRKRLTLLIDGWEDRLRRSLYGSVASEVNQYPVVLSVEDVTGYRGSADKIFETSQKALKSMELEDGRNFIACTTDNPTVMQAYRRKFQDKFFWVLTFACFLHGLNTIIGEIVAYPAMKKVITKVTRIISFFNNSHYWGGQLNSEAKKQNIHRKMKQNCESRWYALILQSLSVQSYRNPLSLICFRPDAQKKTNGLSPVASDIINIILRDNTVWSGLNQLIKTTKPIVDAIGNLEARENSLADCMLELIRCARAMTRLQFDPDEDDMGFWMHAKSVFNRRFHAMNTNIHSLTLFLHPLCRKLAISQAANGRSFEFMVKTALGVAQQWRWSEGKAKLLVEDLKQYHHCKGPFVGGQAHGLDWWESLPINAESHPLKTLAVVLFSIVPHSADVERLFSDLGGTQSIKRCNLTVNTIETLGKLRANYSHHLYQQARAAGKPIHRHHGHMHSRRGPGINTDLVEELEANFAWVPPLSMEAEHADDYLEGPETISLEELDEAFKELETSAAQEDVVDSDGQEVLEGEMYDFDELERVERGLVPVAVELEVNVIGNNSEVGTWDVNQLMSSGGVSSF